VCSLSPILLPPSKQEESFFTNSLVSRNYYAPSMVLSLPLPMPAHHLPLPRYYFFSSSSAISRGIPADPLLPPSLLLYTLAFTKDSKSFNAKQELGCSLDIYSRRIALPLPNTPPRLPGPTSSGCLTLRLLSDLQPPPLPILPTTVVDLHTSPAKHQVLWLSRAEQTCQGRLPILLDIVGHLPSRLPRSPRPSNLPHLEQQTGRTMI
jgi:hypothetical protein